MMSSGQSCCLLSVCTLAIPHRDMAGITCRQYLDASYQITCLVHVREIGLISFPTFPTKAVQLGLWHSCMASKILAAVVACSSDWIGCAIVLL